MKLNHLIYTLMLGTALGTSSCSWLDLEPATAVSPSILGQGEVEQLLTGTTARYRTTRVATPGYSLTCGARI